MNTEIIHNKIYEIRGHKVMLDYEIAEMYEVETKRINEQVKRNIERFPEDFMFQLTENEWVMMRSQIVTTSDSNWSQIATSLKKHRGKSYLPFADRKNISKQINSIKDELSERIDEQDVQIIEIYQVLDKLIQDKEEQKPVKREPIGFKSTNKKH